MRRAFVKDIIQHKDFFSLPGSTTVQKAVEVMTQGRVGAVLVIDQETLRGIFTERDLLYRVIGVGKNPKTTRLDEVMTVKPHTLPPTATLPDALDLMRSYGYRHVPITDGKNMVFGMVSIRDLYLQVHENLQQDIQQYQQYIFGAGYGGSA